MTDILLVEDDARVAEFVKRGLAAEGNNIVAVERGRDALACLDRQNFHVVVLDVMLPDLSGKKVCRQLRERGNTTPVLMLTALDAVEDRVEGLRSGADDYLIKPFDFDELLARIDALVRRGTKGFNESRPVVEASGLRLDRANMTAAMAGRPIELTSKEFELADVLVRAEGRVVSRMRILNKVWGLNSDPLTNIVDVYIRRLRQKLAPEDGIIRTVRGYGYKIDAMQNRDDAGFT